MKNTQHYLVEVDVSGKAVFEVEAGDRKEAESIVKHMQSPNSESYNEFWGYVFDAVEYKIAGIRHTRSQT